MNREQEYQYTQNEVLKIAHHARTPVLQGNKEPSGWNPFCCLGGRRLRYDGVRHGKSTGLAILHQMHFQTNFYGLRL